MALKGGYWGKILCVDLSSEETSVGTFDESFARKYLGGVGLAARIIYENVTKSTNPLGPGNVLVFATGTYQVTNITKQGGGAERQEYQQKRNRSNWGLEVLFNCEAAFAEILIS